MCVSVCVRGRERKCVSTLTSAVQTPHFTASAPLSIAPCSLYAPSLSFYFASIRPPPHCVTRTAIYSSLVPLATLITLCLPSAFFYWPLVSQSACFDLSDWFLDWLSISLLVGHSVCLYLWLAFLSAHLSACLLDSCEKLCTVGFPVNISLVFPGEPISCHIWSLILNILNTTLHIFFYCHLEKFKNSATSLLLQWPLVGLYTAYMGCRLCGSQASEIWAIVNTRIYAKHWAVDYDRFLKLLLQD